MADTVQEATETAQRRSGGKRRRTRRVSLRTRRGAIPSLGDPSHLRRSRRRRRKVLIFWTLLIGLLVVMGGALYVATHGRTKVKSTVPAHPEDPLRPSRGPFPRDDR